MEWFNTLDAGLKIYWMIAGVASLIFIIQMIMTFVGADGGDGGDANFGDGATDLDSSFPGFSVRNLVNFFLGVGWGGICFYNTFESKAVVTIFALLTGIVFVLFFFLIIRQLLKLGRDNSFQIGETVGKPADVYLAIPEKKSGKGKIQISVRGAFHEIDAQTEGERIATGAIVKVEKIIDNQTVLVKQI